MRWLEKLATKTSLDDLISIPLRPNHVFILGAGWIKRALINTLISVASLFTKEKVDVRFATLDDVMQDVDAASLPVYTGHPDARGGGMSRNEDVVGYVRRRLQNFPQIPNL